MNYNGQRIRLETASRHHVEELVIPGFEPPPGVVVWGERVFVLHGPSMVDSTDRRLLYVETFAYSVPMNAARKGSP